MANETKKQEQPIKQEQAPQQFTPSPKPEKTWDQQVSEYLLANGWRKVGVNERGVSVWADPLGTNNATVKRVTIVDNGKTKEVWQPINSSQVRLPIKGAAQGEVEIINQVVGDPIPWDYIAEEAVSIQRQRDRDGGSLDKIIEVRRRELAMFEERKAAQEVQPV